MAETPRTGKSSVNTSQSAPSLVVFHKPPAGAPIYKVLASNGSRAITFIRPSPGFQCPVTSSEVAGPIASHSASVR